MKFFPSSNNISASGSSFGMCIGERSVDQYEQNTT